MATELAKAYVQIIPSAEGIQGALGKLFGKEADKAGRDAGATMTSSMSESLAGGLGGVTKKIGAALAGAFAVEKIAGFGEAVVDVTAGFEDAMLKVQSLSGASEKQYKKLTEAAVKYGSTTAWTSKDVADAMGYMALAGFDTNEILASTGGMLSLASASGEELATVTDILTDSMTGFGDTAADAGRYADVLATVQAKTNTTVGMLGDAFKYVSPLAGSFGYELEDISTALGQMANAGVKGSMAGTSLVSIITRLGTNMDGCRDNLEAMGIEFYNSDGSARALGDVLMELADATASMTVEQKSMIAKNVAGQEAQKGLLAILNQGSETYGELRDKLQKCSGAAENMAQNMESGLGGAIRTMQSAFEGFQISLGQKFSGPLGDAIRGAAEHLTEITPKIADFAGRAMENMAAAGEFIGGAIEKIKGLDIFGDILTRSGEAFEAFTGTVQTLWTENGQVVMDAIQEKITWIRDNASQIFMSVSDTFSQVASNVGEQLSFLLDHSSEIFDGIQTVIGIMWDVATTKWETIGRPIFESVLNIVEITADFFSENMDWILETWNSVVSGISDTWTMHLKPAFEAIGSFLENYLLPFFEGVFRDGILPAVKDVFDGIVDLWKHTLKPIFDGICDFLTGVFTANWGKAFGGLFNIARGALNAIPTAVEHALNAAVDIINSLIGGANSIMEKVGVVNLIPTIPHLELPHLEKGGVLERGQVGLLEGNGAEAVVPLEKNQKWISRVAVDMSRQTNNKETMDRLDRVIDIMDRYFPELAEQKQVVLNGNVVGEIASEMDSHLGRIATHKGRRN